MIEKLKVLIIDDHTLFRKGLKEILLDTSYIEDCKEAKTDKKLLILFQGKSLILFFLI